MRPARGDIGLNARPPPFGWERGRLVVRRYAGAGLDPPRYPRSDEKAPDRSLVLAETCHDQQVLPPPSDDDASPAVSAGLPRRLSDRYELSDLLGLGGMSEVHLARDVRLRRDVAVKLLRVDLARDSSLTQRFQREAQHAAALNHPAIAAVYDTGEVPTPNGPLPYIVMEYVDGQTLREVVSSDGPMTQPRAIEVIAEVCQALNFSHQRGIIHRDVKPANIMIGTAGSVKVVDFGIAKAIAEGHHGVTQTGAVLGTAHYLSPEQARGDRVDARTDVYSLGCVLYEMATGEPPFVGDSAVAVAYQHVRQQAIPPSTRNTELSPDLDAIVLKAMAKNPDNRYQTAADMRIDLIRLLDDIAPSTSPGGATTSGTRAGSVRRWLIAVAALAVLAAAVTVGVDRMRQPSTDGATVVATTTGRTTTSLETVINSIRMIVPDVSSLTYAEAVRTLTDAGFGRFRQVSAPSTEEQRDRVLGTNPLANRPTASTSEITLVMGSGPPLGNP